MGAGFFPLVEPMPDDFRPWDLETIVKYLDENGMRILIVDGQPQLKCLPQTPKEDKARILPHLQARKSDLIAYFTGEHREKSYTEARTEARQARIRMIRLLQVEGAAIGKACYYLLASGLIETFRRTLPDEATYIILQGEEQHQWRRLPPLPRHPGA